MLRMLQGHGEEPLTPDKFAQKLERANAQVDRLGVLLDKLLDVGRIAENRLILEPRPTELLGLARDVANRFEEQATKAGVTLEVRDRAPVEGVWDADRLDQALTNLVSNAIRYAGGKPVEIDVEGSADCARIKVRDQGPGIAPKDQARIFQRFERASSDNSLGGIGLGLWIVRELLELHGGTVKVESSLGKGSTFILELPRIIPSVAEANGQNSSGG